MVRVGQDFDLAARGSRFPRLGGIHTHPRDPKVGAAGRQVREGEWHSPIEQFHGFSRAIG